MVEFISNLIGNSKLATLVMSLFPLVELKGAIVYARGAGLDFFFSFLLAYIGSTIVFFLIFFLLKPILNLLKKIKFFSIIAQKIEGYFEEKANIALEKQKEKGKTSSVSQALLKQIGVFIFVAIPLPMTGVWTGTAVAVFLNLKFKDAILPVVIGNFVAGLLISILAQICITFFEIIVLDYILYALFILAVILLVVFIVKIIVQKPKTNKEQNNVEGK